MNDNIIAVHIPNAVSILIIVALGFVILAAMKKLTGKGIKSPADDSGPTFSG